jgi:hypothetical protein
MSFSGKNEPDNSLENDIFSNSVVIKGTQDRGIKGTNHRLGDLGREIASNIGESILYDAVSS